MSTVHENIILLVAYSIQIVFLAILQTSMLGDPTTKQTTLTLILGAFGYTCIPLAVGVYFGCHMDVAMNCLLTTF